MEKGVIFHPFNAGGFLGIAFTVKKRKRCFSVGRGGKNKAQGVKKHAEGVGRNKKQGEGSMSKKETCSRARFQEQLGIGEV